MKTRSLLTAVLCVVFLTVPAYAESDVDAPAAPSGRSGVLDDADQMLQTVEAIEAFLDTYGTPPDETSEGATVLDARQCVAMAFEQNAQVLVAEADWEAARARIGQARSQMFPQIKASTAYVHTEYNYPEPNSTLTAFGKLTGGLSGMMGGSAAGLTPDSDFRVDELSLDQVFFAGGQIHAALAASKYLAESQEWQKEATLAQLEFDTKQAYYDALLAGALVKVAEQSVRSFERNLADAEQMFAVGMISNFEILRARTEVGNRKAALVEAKNGERLAMANLRRYLALPQGSVVALTPKFEWAPEPAPVSEYVELANANRPELMALERGIKAAEKDVRRVRGQYLPQVGGNITYQNTDRGGSVTPDGWTFTVGAEWELCTSGRRRYETKEAVATLHSLEHQLVDLQRLVELDVTQSHIRIQDAMARIRSERGNVELAQEGLRLAELRFKEGVGTQSETLDAELALTSAETALVQALRNYAVANASLERATGNGWMRARAGEER